MAKVFLVTQEEMNELIETLEMVKLRKLEHLGIHDPKRQEIDDMHRSFNFVACGWVQRMGASPARH